MSIHEILHKAGAYGVDRAMPTKELMHITGYTQRRLVARVQQENEAGARPVICSSLTGRGGYYLPASPEMEREYIQRKRREAGRTLKRWSAALGRAAHDEEGAGLFEENGGARV